MPSPTPTLDPAAFRQDMTDAVASLTAAIGTGTDLVRLLIWALVLVGGVLAALALANALAQVRR